MTLASSPGAQVQPSLARALHDIVVVEVLADRLSSRLDPGHDSDAVTTLVADALDYFLELASAQIEGKPVTHGVVLCADPRGWTPVHPEVRYPGRLRSRKRTSLLFDGTESVLAVTADGLLLGDISRSTLPSRCGGESLAGFDEFPGISGALTAAGSSGFHGIGILLRADRSIWIFDDGEPLFIRRANRWKSIAAEPFARWLASLGRTRTDVAEVLTRAVLRSSIHGTGALFAIAPDHSSLKNLISSKDLTGPATRTTARTVDDDIHALLSTFELMSPAGLARLARLDGATVISRVGELLAYGAIVRGAHSRGEGARTAAARSLSLQVDVAVSISQDGPVSVFHHGEIVLEML